MKTFQYSFFSKFLYNYGNIPLTFLVLIYFILSVQMIPQNSVYIFTALFHASVIVLMNRFYFKRYKYFPNKIQTDGKNIICSEFIWKNRKVVIPFDKISDLSGGVFDGKLGRPMYIYDNTQNIKVGFTERMKNSKELVTDILVNIRRDKYEEIMKRISDIAEDSKEKRKKKLHK